MSTYEMLAVAISTLALIISIISFLKNHKLTMGQVEMQINQMISSARTRVSDLGIQNSDLLSKDDSILTQSEKTKKTLLEKIINEAKEANLNAYDEACSKYIDKKVDMKRFEKNYKAMIRQLVESQQYSGYFGVTSKYQSILEVYKKWEGKV